MPRMKILVTGATGLLGNNIVRSLLERQADEVRVLARRPDDRSLENLRVDVVRGDVRERDAVLRAAEGCQAILHSAAAVQLGWTKLDEHRQINVEGTRHIVEAARAAGARLVHISTVDTLGIGQPDRPVKEDDSKEGKVPCTYVTTKREAEAVVEEGIAAGLDAVIVHPGFMLGPWDWKPSSGRMMLELGKRYIPACPTGGCSVCDVRDVAAGVLSALERGRTGRHYLMAGVNWRYRKLWTEMARRMGRPAPIFPVGPMIRAGVGAFAAVKVRLTKLETDVNSAALKMSSQLHWYDGSRAREELGYNNRDIHETLDDAAAWIRERFLPGR